MEKYTLKDLEKLDNAGELIGKDLGGCWIDLAGSGKWHYYKLFSTCEYGWKLYSTPEQELTIGLVKAINRHIKENR